ncbi:TadE/TadG family type IV pilus assembly protein [Streptomyces sp. NPDC058297]|uniref:TadE/TadG family type IV pilus assembly protein n=1 Tax=Streptomyces sp. NPDC058297 TaxID=3346433 RepID=UPI0036E6BEB7
MEIGLRHGLRRSRRNSLRLSAARGRPPRLRTENGPHHALRRSLRHAPRRTPITDDRGVSILEFAGFLPFLLLIGMAAIQLGLVGYSANQAGSGARAAARVQSQGGDGTGAGRAAMSGWLDADIDAGGGGGGGDTTTATVTVHVPVLVPFLDDRWDVRRTATMPNDRDPEGG